MITETELLLNPISTTYFNVTAEPPPDILPVRPAQLRPRPGRASLPAAERPGRAARQHLPREQQARPPCQAARTAAMPRTVPSKYVNKGKYVNPGNAACDGSAATGRAVWARCAGRTAAVC